MEKKLYRDEHRKSIGGVCAGLADYFGVDVSVVRVLFVLAVFLKGIGLLPYIVLWIVLPKKPFSYNDPTFKPGVDPGFGAGAGFHPGYKPYGDVKVDYTVPPPNTMGQPFAPYPQAKKPSNAGMIFGVVLIALGSIFLLDQLDFIPDWDFEKLWPVVLVAAGAAILFSAKKQPWEKEGWHADAKQPDVAAGTKTEEQPNDNTQTL